MARLNEPDERGADEVGRLRRAWVSEPPRHGGPVRLDACAAREWTCIRQYADAESDVVEEILRRS